MEPWHTNSWQSKPARQQPVYEDPAALRQVAGELSSYPPLVFAREIDQLKQSLAGIRQGEGFLLQGGDCAESFAEFNAGYVKDNLALLLHMGMVLMVGTGLPVTKIGRIAGQMSKPRSDAMETIDGVSLPVYRGDMVNGIAFEAQTRRPDPKRMLRAYHQSAATLNLLRAFLAGGVSDLLQLNASMQTALKTEKKAMAAHYKLILSTLEESLKFMKACGLDSQNTPQLRSTPVYTSHEALLLPYDAALTRQDSQTGKFYNVGAHMVWVGARTGDPDEAHVEYVRGISNPIGVKIGSYTSVEILKRLMDILNPAHEEGKIVLISRMGAGAVRDHLSGLVEACVRQGYPVLWTCDPMHGNTYKSKTGYKTRRMGDIFSEIKDFFEVVVECGAVPNGIHLEMTGKDVTECIGGAVGEIKEEDLSDRYHTHCDPRLNKDQSLEIAFLVSHMIKESRRNNS